MITFESLDNNGTSLHGWKALWKALAGMICEGSIALGLGVDSTDSNVYKR